VKVAETAPGAIAVTTNFSTFPGGLVGVVVDVDVGAGFGVGVGVVTDKVAGSTELVSLHGTNFVALSAGSKNCHHPLVPVAVFNGVYHWLYMGSTQHPGGGGSSFGAAAQDCSAGVSGVDGTGSADVVVFETVADDAVEGITEDRLVDGTGEDEFVSRIGEDEPVDGTRGDERAPTVST
jgi:hypothetical protein